MRNCPRGLLAVFVVTLAGFALTQSVSAPPATPKRPITDQYQGVNVTDDYRWLENWDDPEVKQWNAAQNARDQQRHYTSPRQLFQLGAIGPDAGHLSGP